MDHSLLGSRRLRSNLSGAWRRSGATWSSAQGSGVLDLLKDNLAAGGSFVKLGLDLSHPRVGSLLHFRVDVADFLLDFLVVLPSLLGGINSQASSPSELLLDSGLLAVELTLLLFLVALGTGQGHQVVLLCLLRDGGHELGLTLLGGGVLLRDFLLNSLFLSLLDRIASLSDEKNFFVVGASFLLNAAHFLVPFGGGGRHLAFDDADEVLSLGPLLAVLALLGDADAVGVLAALLHLTGDLLSFSLVGPVEFVLNHLESDLDL